MGSGIAQVIAQAGMEVIMRDFETKFVEKGLSYIKQTLKKSVEKAKITQEEADSVLFRIKGTLDFSEASKDADFIVEAIIENRVLKKTLFKELDDISPARTIFATNTSFFSITEIASVTTRPDKFLGLHFF
jgi:3-hydroxyacyl-CoA dehydrogenase (EC 1.1.1.35)